MSDEMLRTPAAPGIDLQWLVDGLDEIGSECRNLRQGGCDVGDLAGLEAGLSTAVDTAHELRDRLLALIDASPKAGSGQFDYKADFFNSNGAAVRAEGVLLEARNWFEEQAKVISKGGGSSWDLHQVRDMRDRCDSVLQATSAEVTP